MNYRALVLSTLFSLLLTGCTTLGPQDYNNPTNRDHATCDAQAESHSMVCWNGNCGKGYRTYDNWYDSCMRSLGYRKRRDLRNRTAPQEESESEEVATSKPERPRSFMSCQTDCTEMKNGKELKPGLTVDQCISLICPGVSQN